MSSSEDGCVKVWSLQTYTEVRTLPKNKCPIQSVAVSTNLEIIAAGGEDGQIKLWNI